MIAHLIDHQDAYDVVKRRLEFADGNRTIMEGVLLSAAFSIYSKKTFENEVRVCPKARWAAA